MTASSTLPAPNLMPLLRYRDLAAAMSWLEQAFEFEKQISVSDSDGAAIYGQMSYRGGLMMMGAVRDTDLDKLMRQPDEVGGVETQSCYLVVDDADAHYARAQGAGAEIVLEIKSDGLGRRGYSCRDPEGHIWNFGTYNPGRGMQMPAAAVAAPAVSTPTPEPAPRRGRKLMGLVALLGLGAALSGCAGISDSS
uniref:VOC family protein n=1 Tax=uncultured Hyphomicrobium sp. TaxID=194373 RepID=UPI0025D8B24E